MEESYESAQLHQDHPEHERSIGVQDHVLKTTTKQNKELFLLPKETYRLCVMKQAMFEQEQYRPFPKFDKELVTSIIKSNQIEI